jgi:hypothetical protein
MSSTMSLHPLKKIVNKIFFVPMACRFIGMTPVGDRAHMFEDG